MCLAPSSSVIEDDLAAARRDFLHVAKGLFHQLVGRRDDDHRHRFVDQRDRPVLELAGRIALGVDVADFLELQRAFHGDREHLAAAEIEHVLGLAQALGDLLDLRLGAERLRDGSGQRGERAHQLGLLLARRCVPRATPAAITRLASAVSCAVSALVEATPISGPQRVGNTTSLSRPMVDSGTLSRLDHVLALARRSSAAPRACRRSRPTAR